MADRNDRSDMQARRCRELARIMLPALRECARVRGYAIGIHGSVAYDIDLIAAPWAFNACSPRTLAEALQRVIQAVLGFAYDPELEGAINTGDTARAERVRNGKPGSKPFGRLVWSFHVGGGPYFDLSVMPKIEDDK